jgi:S-adenosylmethionine hydrolase
MVQDNGQMMNYTVGKITCDCDFKPKELPVFKVITNTDGTTQTITAVDSFGNIITKPAYKIRYLKPDGTIIPQDIYNEMISNGETAYIAAFIGCTYHCG